MSNLIIDAPLLACPNPLNFTQEEFQEIFLRYLQGISDVSELRANCKSVKVWRDSQLSAVLHEENCYPFRHALLPAFERLTDDVEFQLQDINVLAMSLLDKTLCFEEEGDVVDVIVTDCEILVDVVLGRSKTISDHLCRQICLALPLLGDGRVFKKNTYLASEVFTEEIPTVKVKYFLEMIEFADGTYADSDSEKFVEISNFRSVGSLMNSSDLTDWWACGHDFAEMDSFCISVAKSEEKPFEKIALLHSRFSFGSEFLPSAGRHGFLHDATKISKLLRVCSDLANGRNSADSHSLRVGKGGNDPQRSRGEWKAWRHDVDYEYHLHYWKNGQNIELSNIVVHNDFSIY